MARYLAQRPKRPARQVVFIAFSAEEEGLLGSALLRGPSAGPAGPHRGDDQPGHDRGRDNRLFVRGTFTAAGWRELLERLGARERLSLVLSRRLFGSSDHLSFYAKEIPVMEFFTGRHEDYHEPSDKFAKLNFTGMRQVARVARNVLADLADAQLRPQYVAAVPPQPGSEAYSGAFGDFTCAGPGYVLGPVAKGSPAAQAGLHDGDLVVQLGKERISTADDFNEAITHYVGGQRVRVLAKRAGQPPPSTCSWDVRWATWTRRSNDLRRPPAKHDRFPGPLDVGQIDHVEKSP